MYYISIYYLCYYRLLYPSPICIFLTTLGIHIFYVLVCSNIGLYDVWLQANISLWYFWRVCAPLLVTDAACLVIFKSSTNRFIVFFFCCCVFCAKPACCGRCKCVLLMLRLQLGLSGRKHACASSLFHSCLWHTPYHNVFYFLQILFVIVSFIISLNFLFCGMRYKPVFAWNIYIVFFVFFVLLFLFLYFLFFFLISYA